MPKLKSLLLSSLALGLTIGVANSETPQSDTKKIDDNILVNGQKAKGLIGSTSKVIFEQTDKNGTTRRVVVINREPNTRSPVHTMNYAVTSCVNKGQATMYLEGVSPETTQMGHCYVMPAGIKGYIYNSGESELELTDYQVITSGNEVSHKLEH